MVATGLSQACDGPLLFALAVVMVLAVLALPWVQVQLAERHWPPHSFAWRYLSVLALGGAVGAAELVSRYRDEPTIVLRSSPARAYVLFNAGAAAFALFLCEYFPATLTPPADGVARVMLAGFGAMLILRSKLLTFRQPGGGDVAVGPAFVVDTLIAAINRAVDRRRAESRLMRVSTLARDFATASFIKTAPMLTSSLLAFQNMDREDLDRLKTSIETLAKDAALTDEVRFARIGYDILTVFGEAVFDRVFYELRPRLS